MTKKSLENRMPFGRRWLPRLGAVAAVLAGLAGNPAARLSAADNPPEAAKPNIIFILLDDLGYGDLGCYGQKIIRTPRIDRMAAEGMRFTAHYTGAPLCAPARCSLMTGLHMGHCRIRSNGTLPMTAEDVMFPQLLKQAGYVTGASGKWGLGNEGTDGVPWKHGFDHFFGFLDQLQAHSHYPDFLCREGRRVEIPENKGGQRGRHTQDLFIEHTLEFIRANKDKPFFYFASWTAPHAEMLVPQDSLDEYVGKVKDKPFKGAGKYSATDTPNAAYAGLVTRVDGHVGRILDLLDELGIAKNTLVIFTSDNGPAMAGGKDSDVFDSNGPLRGLKFGLYEGGIRVPMIARWPGRIAPGTTSDAPGVFYDWMPTLAELAGAKAPGTIDGVSLLPTLLGSGRQARQEYLYWEYKGQQAVRMGDWKAIRTVAGDTVELFDLKGDPGEQNDIAAAHPDIVARARACMAAAHTPSAEFPLEAGPKAPPAR